MFPSSFIPYLVLGVQIDQFDLPVCHKFKPHVINGMLCYQIDVNEFRNQIDDEKVMHTGLIFVMDYNLDIIFFLKY